MPCTSMAVALENAVPVLVEPADTGPTRSARAGFARRAHRPEVTPPGAFASLD